jgi:phosphatidylserine/phosphatidylglycerophosphate/cardiolipin synthase-like enzyme
MDNSKAHMHHKFALLDNRCLLNGSFNWTRAAHLENKENVLLTSNAKLVKPFADEFESLWREFEHNKVKL